ncbi:MAG: hypothetical protein KAR42_17005 [candidate division Zixibacteria bacterium]|nr:hypothetical protein [candidate division Zixibacteria bacterium]
MKEEKKPEEKKKDQGQANLFGDKDQIYNTIQTEISIIVSQIGSRQDSIDKQKVQIIVLQKRKDSLERAARSVAKMRDEEIKRKKEERLKK